MTQKVSRSPRINDLPAHFTSDSSIIPGCRSALLWKKSGEMPSLIAILDVTNKDVVLELFSSLRPAKTKFLVSRPSGLGRGLDRYGLENIGKLQRQLSAVRTNTCCYFLQLEKLLIRLEFFTTQLTYRTHP